MRYANEPAQPIDFITKLVLKGKIFQQFYYLNFDKFTKQERSDINNFIVVLSDGSLDSQDFQNCNREYSKI